MYKMVTGKVPDEAIERIVNDELISPKELDDDISGAFNKDINKSEGTLYIYYPGEFETAKYKLNIVVNYTTNQGDEVNEYRIDLYIK